METHTTALPAGAAKTDLEIARQNTAAIKTRLAQFCAWFELTPPRLKVARTGVCRTDELAVWVQSVGISWDWLFLGDAHGMAQAFRRANSPVAEARKLVAAMTDEQLRLSQIAARAYVDGVVTFDDAMATIKAMMQPPNEVSA